MSAISSQRRVYQRTKVEQNELQAKIMDRTLIAERNVVRADIMVPPLSSIHETIQHYQWTYLFTCACAVLTRLVRLNEVVLPPSMDELREFFHMVPQGEGRQTSIKIGALDLWPVTRRSDLILKKAQFVYVVHVRLPFFLWKHILRVMLEARDEGTAGLPFGCLLSQIILQSVINIDGEPRMKIKQPLSKQRLMMSNAQLRREESDEDMPAAMHVAFPDVASSSHTVPPSEPEVNFSQVMEALAAIQGGMTTMQQSIFSMQMEMWSISKRVEQTHLELQECLQVHHPDSSDDDGVTPRRCRATWTASAAEDV
jgi:hypothetical protein